MDLLVIFHLRELSRQSKGQKNSKLRLESGQTFSIPDLVCLYMGQNWTLIWAIVITSSILLSLYRAYRHWLAFNKEAFLLISQSISYQKPLLNPLLQQKIKNKRIAVKLAPAVSVPCLVGLRHPTILLPPLL